MLLVVIAATSVVAPMFFLGNASGHDFEFHLASWLDAAGQWREGTLYPRWAEWANWGFGEPRFVFYPPASWMAGAALGSVLPWRMVPGVFIWLALILAGFHMWRLAREWLPGPQAAAAAVFFAVNPYHLVVVYYRSDFAELLASALLPWMIWQALRVHREGWRGVPMLAVSFAAIWISNAPAAVVTTYSLVLLLAVGAILRRSFEPLIAGGAAMAAGFGLAAFYILPAMWEQRWVQIAEAVGQNLRSDQNFLFTHSNDPEFVLFNWKVSGVALGVMLVVGIACVLSARLRRNFPELWWMLLALGATSVLLMFPPSALLWRSLPELRFVQFPWRWLVPLDVVFAFFVAAAMGRARRQWIGWLVLIVAIGGAGTLMVRDAWWDSEDIPTLHDGIASGHGYEGTDEYAPLGCDRYNLPEKAPRIAKLDPQSGRVVPASGVRAHIERWTGERRVFMGETAQGVTLAPRLVNYPAWEVQVDGRTTLTKSDTETGQLFVPLSPGTHTVEILFRRTWDRAVGAVISVLMSGLLIGLELFFRRRNTPAQHYSL